MQKTTKKTSSKTQNKPVLVQKNKTSASLAPIRTAGIKKESSSKARVLKKQTGAVKKTIAKAPALIQKEAAVVKNAVKPVNIPNLLTMIRIWAIPLIVLTFFFHSPFWAWTGVVLFAIAGITDYMDGYLARHLNQLSRFGRVLDPIADKLLVGSVLLMLAYSGALGTIGIIPAVVIMCREILVSGLREFLAEIKVGCPVTRLAKWKTACQMSALPLLMIAPAYNTLFGTFMGALGIIALWGAAILTVMTGYDYWKSGRRYMNEE